MVKNILLYFLFAAISIKKTESQPVVKRDTLLTIIQLKDERAREKQLLNYFESHFSVLPLNKLDSAKTVYRNILFKYNVENKWAFAYWIESLCLDKLSHKNESENAFVKAIDFADRNEDHYLLYIFLNYLAYKQTEDGNAIGAITSYRLAKKEAAKLGEDLMQLIIDVNISDVNYKNNFYSQSLFYLDQAESINYNISQKDKVNKARSQRLEVTIDYNKCENFFRMNSADSLKKYNGKLNRSKSYSRKLYTYKNRTGYYLFLLHHDYKSAAKLINAMQKDSSYIFSDLDKRNLADAYFKNGQTDSASQIINQLLRNPAETNHPELKFHQYEMLAKISENKSDHKQAAVNFKLALQQSEDYNNKLTQVGNISSLIKIDDIENTYNQREEAFQRERIWLLFAVFVALFTIVIIGIIYWNIKQKRHYEKLLFTAKKEELSFINSHEVRKHLTNILGLIEVIRNSENKEEEFSISEEHLFYSAGELDKAIKNISKKLDD